MAEKQATIYVVDLGKSMSKTTGDREESDLAYAESYIWDKITTTVRGQVANGRKTDTVGVIGFHTDGSDNTLLKMGDEYNNISILNPVGQFLMPQVRSLQQLLVASDTDEGDGISAVVVAIDMIEKYCKKLKYVRNIILVTNGTGLFDTDGVEEIISKIRDNGIRLTILGVDFDDAEYGFKEEDKEKGKLENELALKAFCDKCNEGKSNENDPDLAQFGTLAEAVEALANPRTKKTRPVASFKGSMTLGKPDGGEGTFSIDVERYPKTMQAKPVSASTFVAAHSAPDDAGERSPSSTAQNGAPQDLTKVRNARTYQIDDESAPGGKMDIAREDMAKGYMYGATVVPISASDADIVKFETEAGLQIIGFVSRRPFERFLAMSRSNIIVGSKVNDKAIVALSSFIHALIELDILAIARLVVKDGKPPVIVIMAALIEPDYECLIDVEIPFAEDVRQYKFAPLDTVKTISGKKLDKHRFIPSEELQEAMNDYVDSMDILTLSTDTNEDGTPADPIPVDETFSPLLHRINQVIRWRATHQNSTNLPEIYPSLVKYANPPADLLTDAKGDIDRLATVSELKRVPPKAKGTKRNREEQKPLSGLDVDALLSSTRAKRTKINPDNAIPDFIQMTNDIAVEDLGDQVNQMAKIIKETVKNSMADSAYGAAIEEIKVVRRVCLEAESAGVYNVFCKDLKAVMQGKSLNGERKDFWTRIRMEKLGLITKEEDRDSDISPEDARKFLYERA